MKKFNVIKGKNYSLVLQIEYKLPDLDDIRRLYLCKNNLNCCIFYNYNNSPPAFGWQAWQVYLP